jgi:hypothetical protein
MDYYLYIKFYQNLMCSSRDIGKKPKHEPTLDLEYFRDFSTVRGVPSGTPRSRFRNSIGTSGVRNMKK